MMLYLRLFFEFFKTGLFAIGGGMATIPFLYDMADATGWFTYEDLANMVAVGESTPGPIGVNMATYVGYVTGMNEGGVWGAIAGAIVATVGLVAPSVIVIMIISTFLKAFRDGKYVTGALYGLRPASAGLIASAGLGVLMSNLFYTETLSEGLSWALVNWKGWILASVLWIMTNKVEATKKMHLIIFIVGSAAVGIIFSL